MIDHKDGDKKETVTYEYDKAGNRIKKAEGNAQTAYTYNGLDQLLTAVTERNGEKENTVTYEYDVNGNQVKESDSKSQVTTVNEYDAENRLSKAVITMPEPELLPGDVAESEAGTATGQASEVAETDGTASGNRIKTITQENLYNGDGQRVRKSEGAKETYYFYQDGVVSYTMEGKKETKAVQNLLGLEGNVILAERAVEISGEPTSEGGTSGKKAEDGAASEETKNRNFDYYLYNKDVQGSTTSILDEDGAGELSYEYDDFGETEVNGNSVFRNENCYTGGIYDETTGLYYLNARYYDPENGRFLTEDTYRGELKEPDTLHLYVYCKNNPINYVDPSGHIAANVVGAVIGAVLGAVGGAVLSKWLANKLNLKGWKRKTFIVGITALVGATASAIGYFVGPYVAKTWHYLTAKLAGLLKGTYKSIKIPKQTMKHINVKKHLWNKVVKGSTDTGIKTVMYRAIRNGTWQLQKDGSVKILWMYKGEIIQVTGKVVNNVLRIGSAWVARR